METLSKASQGAKDTLSKASQGAKDTLSKASQGAKDTLSKASQGAKDTLTKASQGAKDTKKCLNLPENMPDIKSSNPPEFIFKPGWPPPRKSIGEIMEEIFGVSSEKQIINKNNSKETDDLQT